METTRTILYRDILIEDIGFEAYQEGGPNGTVVLDEGAIDFIKGMIKAPANAIKKKIDERYKRIEKIEKAYQKSLKKMGVDTNELDNELKNIVHKNIANFKSGFDTNNGTHINKGFAGIKEALSKSVVLNTISNRLKQLDPDTYLPVLSIYTMTVMAKIIVMIFVVQFTGNLFEWDKLSRHTQIIHGFMKLTSIIVIGPIIDQIGIHISIKSNVHHQYQVVSNLANSTASVFFMKKHVNAPAFGMFINRAFSVIASVSAGTLMKRGKNVDDKWHNFYAFLVLATQKFIEMLTLGGKHFMWQYPG